ncbi:hypothetical protein [Sphingobacterium corticibacter]|nr:hypothetical protein [Sphingobacterium corticibacter]
MENIHELSMEEYSETNGGGLIVIAFALGFYIGYKETEFANK